MNLPPFRGIASHPSEISIRGSSDNAVHAYATRQGRYLDVWSYIAADNETAADRVEQAIYDAFAFAAQAPLRGHSRRDLTARSVRFRTLTRHPDYAIVSRPETAPLEIGAVMHGKRSIRRILKARR